MNSDGMNYNADPAADPESYDEDEDGYDEEDCEDNEAYYERKGEIRDLTEKMADHALEGWAAQEGGSTDVGDWKYLQDQMRELRKDAARVAQLAAELDAGVKA